MLLKNLKMLKFCVMDRFGTGENNLYRIKTIIPMESQYKNIKTSVCVEVCVGSLPGLREVRGGG